MNGTLRADVLGVVRLHPGAEYAHELELDPEQARQLRAFLDETLPE